MATSYDSVKKQASQGENSNNVLKSWFENGLDATNTKIVGGADNQTQTWDEHGMLFRRYNDVTDSYDKTQLKIINSTLAITDDNWETTKTAIGNFYYNDPITGELKNAYGVNGEVVIGRLLLGKELGIYNDSESLTFNENGLKITNGTNTVTINPNSEKLFVLNNQKSDVFYVDNTGKGYFKGELQATSGTLTNLVVDETVYIRNKLKMFCSNELTTRATTNTVEILSLMYDDANQARLTVGNGCSSGIFIPDLYANVLHVQKKGDGTASDGLLDVSNGTTSGFDGLECEKASYNFIVFKADLFKFKNGIKMCYINSTTGGLSAGTDFKSKNQIPNEYKPTRDFRSTFITKQGKKCIIAVTTASNLWVSAIDSIANTDHFDIAFVYV